jgi:hypothetical protein
MDRACACCGAAVGDSRDGWSGCGHPAHARCLLNGLACATCRTSQTKIDGPVFVMTAVRVVLSAVYCIVKCVLILAVYGVCIWLGAPDLLRIDADSLWGKYFPPRCD